MILMPLGLAVIVLLMLCLMRLKSFLHEHRLHKVLFHLATGHHADGHHRNNRTWRQPATRSRTGHHMGWLARRSRRTRMLLFWGGLLTVVYTVIGWFIANTVTVVLLWLSAVSSLLVLLLAVVRRLLRRGHRRTVVNPIAAKLAAHMKQSPVAVARNLKIRPNLDALAPGDEAVILGGFPDEWTHTPSEQSFVEGILTEFLPVHLNFDWETTRFPMRLVARCAASPPKEVTAAGWVNTMDRLSYGQYFLGCSAGDAVEVWDANEQDPHGMCGGRTRRGKTNVNLAIAGQALRRGERISAVDPKRVSLACLVGVPGFRLANDPRNVAAMWQLIASFRTEMDAAIDGMPVRDEHGRTVPHMLILEEINQLFALFRAHWETVPPIPGQTKRLTDVPAWRDVKAVLHQGAQFGYRVLVDGQDLTAQVLFGSRSQFGTILMTGFTPKQWGYAVGTTPIPPSPTRKGRFHLVRGAEHTIVQVVCADPRGGEHNELGWREFALGGRVTEAEQSRSRGWGRPVIRLALPGRVERVAIAPLLIGNKEGAAYLGMTVNAFKVARNERPIPGEFRDKVRGRVQPCWARETLDAWQASRPIAGVRSKVRAG